MTKNENCGLPILNFGLPKLGFRISNMIWITNIIFRKGEVRGLYYSSKQDSRDSSPKVPKRLQRNTAYSQYLTAARVSLRKLAHILEES